MDSSTASRQTFPSTDELSCIGTYETNPSSASTLSHYLAASSDTVSTNYLSSSLVCNPAESIKESNLEDYLSASSHDSISNGLTNSQLVALHEASAGQSNVGLFQETEAEDVDVVQSSINHLTKAAKIQEKRKNRTSLHIISFIRITVSVNPQVTFPLTVDASQTIEYLARLIEAEYAFRHKDIHRRKSKRTRRDSDINFFGAKYEPLVAGLLYDTNKEPLKFSDIVGQVLQLGDLVYVMNSYEDISDILDQSVSDTFLQSNATFSKSQSQLTPTSASSQMPLDKQIKQTFHKDNKFQSVLRNHYGLSPFVEFCLNDRSVESILFWIDVEVLSSSPPELHLLIAKYIYFCYLVENAPLKVNLSEEIKNDILIPWKEKNLAVLTLDSTMYDETQEFVYSVLKMHVFQKFEASSQYADFLKIGKTNQQLYQTGKIKNFASAFKPDLELMLELCGSSISDGSNGAVQKEQILTRIIKRYFPQLQSRPGYFDVMNRLASDNRQIKVHKEKKLTKFFGERVSIEELQKQIDTALSAPMRPARSDSVHSVSANVVRGRRNRKPSEYNSISEVSSSMSQKEESADLFSKKKKVDKLNEFFGDRVPARQLVEQNLVGVANSTAQTSTTEIADIPPTPTLNELSTDERRLLTKRSKKLRDVLGEPLNEDITYKALTEPIFKSTSPPPIRSDSTAVKAADLSAISPQIASHDEAAGTSIDSSTISFSQQAPSTVSSISVEANLDSKEIRRKKLEKLYRFLGERLSENALESLQNQAAQALLKNPNAVVTASNTPLTPDEKRQTVRRAVKLGKMFGAVPPSQLLSEMDKKTLQHRSSIFSLRQVLHDDNALVDLLALMSDSQADGANPTDASVAAKADPTSSVISEEMPVPVDKTFRQKKLHKLQKFFGDKVDPVFLFEQNVLATLERTMEEELDSDSLKELKKDLELLRNEVRNAAPKIDASGGSSEKEKEKEKESNSSAYSFSSLAKLTDRLTSSYAGGSMKESPKLNRKVVSSSYLNDDGNSAPATITSSLKSLKSESK